MDKYITEMEGAIYLAPCSTLPDIGYDDFYTLSCAGRLKELQPKTLTEMGYKPHKSDNNFIPNTLGYHAYPDIWDNRSYSCTGMPDILSSELDQLIKDIVKKLVDEFVPTPETIKPQVGKMFAFEGIDFASKTTNAKRLVDLLNSKRSAKSTIPETLYCKAPGFTPVGRVLRELVLNESISLDVEDSFGALEGTHQFHFKTNVPIEHPLTKEFLHVADLNELTYQVINPAIESGKLTIVDRYKDSTRAYAIGGHDIEEVWINRLLDLVYETYPYKVLYFDCPVDVTLKRKAAVGVRDGGDTLQGDFYQKVYDYYTKLYQTNSQWLRIDASLSEDVVFEQVLYIIESEIGSIYV